MKRFYRPSDRKKKFVDLYKIESINDYIDAISNLEINFQSLKKEIIVHKSYAFIDHYLSNLIDKSNEITFYGVYDLSKEAYYLNKYTDKNITISDINISAIKNAVNNWSNIEVKEITLQDTSSVEGAIIINVAEYFLTQKELKIFLYNGNDVLLTNVQFYRKKLFYNSSFSV